MNRQEKCDVIVVGGGSAAVECAVSARQNGATKVVMVEKAPPDEFGGNARFSHTGFRFAYNGPEDIRYLVPDVDEAEYERFHIPAYSPDLFMEDLNRVTRGRINQDLARFMVDQSASAVRWMHDTGIVFEPEKNIKLDGKYYFEPGIIVHTEGGGLGQLLRWREIALEMDVEIRYETRVTGFLGNFRRIEGIEVSSPDEDYEMVAPSTIVCSGGFQASSEMRARYLGPNADLMRVRGSKHDTGEVLKMLIDLGAKTSGMEGATEFHVYLAGDYKSRISEKTGLNLKGFKMRSTAGYHPMLKKMGAVPINISPGDVYTSLERGLVKGLAWPEGGVARYGWSKFIKYRVGPGWWRTSSTLVMNLDVYNKLTKKERDAIHAASIKYEIDSVESLRARVKVDNAKVFASGVKPVNLTGKAAKAYLDTAYGATWDAAKKVMPAATYNKLRRLLLK